MDERYCTSTMLVVLCARCREKRRATCRKERTANAETSRNAALGGGPVAARDDSAWRAARRGGRAAELSPRALGSRDVGSKFLSFAVDEHGSARTICHGSLHRQQCAKRPSQPGGALLLCAVY